MLPAVLAEPNPPKHAVQFFETASFLGDSVAQFLADGLARGERAVVIATEAHRAAFTTKLQAMDVDVPRAIAADDLVLLDAADTLGAILAEGHADPVRFEETIGGLVRRLSSPTPRRIRAYGEMVDLLWRSDRQGVALELEGLWNELLERADVMLLCGYRTDPFYREGGLPQICATHSHVYPPEVSKRADGDAELRASLAEDFLENAPVAIHRVDRHGIVVWANAFELAALGYKHDEYVGHHITEFHVDRDVIDDVLARLFRGETLHDCKARIRAKDGTIRHFLISSNVQHRDGEGLSTRCFSRDVTALVEAEVSRAEASRVKDQFLAMLGHELRNPLSPILTAVQLMRLRGEDTREQVIIERNVSHLVRMVDELLDLSRVVRGGIDLDLRPVRLGPLVAKALALVAPAVEERQHQLSTALIDDDVWVNADEPRLVQAIAQIVENAAKFTPPGGAIDLRVETGAGTVRIVVTDNGIGIAADQLAKIFDPFVQGARTTDRSRGGLGIGLGLVRHFVSLHGGSVVASSDGLGRGSELAIELPALAAKVRVTARRILVVDDNEDAAVILGEVLQSIGHEVVVAYDALTALEAAARFQPEVAILDLGLPGMDGYELAVKLRAQLASTRIMAVTGFDREAARTSANEAGFDAFFVKPVTLSKILAAIESLFSA